MRDIKFRGISLRDNKFVYGGLVRANGKRGNCLAIKDTICNINNGKCDLIPEVIIAETVGQYTGLSDNNLKEIYEGDILKVTSLENDHNQIGATDIMIVKFFMGNMCMCFNGCEAGKPIYPTLNMKKEVIGNIYETPELVQSI